MQRGFLGGTFDPVHVGHLDVAAAARRALALDLVELVPAGVPPHRQPPSASAADRLAMARLALADRDGLGVSNLEIHDAAPSYTALTLDRLAQLGFDTTTLFFIAGADAFRDIATWRAGTSRSMVRAQADSGRSAS